MKQIPKYQSKGKLPSFTNPAIEEWANDWQWRLTPESRSKVMTKWRYTDKKPKEETSKEYTKRRVKEERDKDKVGKALNTVADALHTVGQTALTAGLLGSTVIAPWETLGAIGAGTAGSAITDNISRRFTGKSWAENIKDKLNLQTTTLPEMFNPGMLLGGWLGSRMAPTVASWFRPVKAVTTPEVKFNPTEAGEYVSPQVRRTDITTSEPLMESAKLSRGQFERDFNLGKIKKESDLYKYMTQPQAKRIFKMASEVKKALGRFSSSNLKGKNLDFYNAVLERSTAGLKGTKGTSSSINKVLAEERALTPEGQLEAIRNRVANKETGETYWDLIRKSAEETGINWADDTVSNPGTYMSGMDAELKLKPVGGHSESFIERYYDNVIKHIIGKGGFQEKILKSGDLRINPETKQWEGKWPDGTWNPVRRPEEYIKARYAREVKGAEIELPKPEVIDGEIYDMIPMHGAGLGENNKPVSKQENNWIEYLRKRSSSPGKNGIWAVIRDNLAKKSYALGHYQQNNYSVPFYRMPKYETKEFSPGNSYGLMKLMHEAYSGKIMRPIKVQDGVPGVINEYNFGPTFDHNPKSLWNTLDFEPGAGPMAYTPTKITVTGNNLA